MGSSDTLAPRIATQPSDELLRRVAYAALAYRAVPYRTRAELIEGGVQCQMIVPWRRAIPRGPRRFYVVLHSRTRLGFNVHPAGCADVDHYRPGEWEAAVDKLYRRAEDLFGSPPEAWHAAFAQPDKSLKGPIGRRLLNVVLLPIGLQVSTTERAARITWRLTPWQLFFWAVCIVGVVSTSVDVTFGNAPAAVLLGFAALFLGGLARSLGRHHGYRSPRSVAMLRNMKATAGKLAELVAGTPGDDDPASTARRVLTMSTEARQELGGPYAARWIERRYRSVYEAILFRATIWANLCLLEREERGSLLFHEVLIHPAHCRHLRLILLDPKNPAIVSLTDPATWVEPMRREARWLTAALDRALE